MLIVVEFVFNCAYPRDLVGVFAVGVIDNVHITFDPTEGESVVDIQCFTPETTIQVNADILFETFVAPYLGNGMSLDR